MSKEPEHRSLEEVKELLRSLEATSAENAPAGQRDAMQSASIELKPAPSTPLQLMSVQAPAPIDVVRTPSAPSSNKGTLIAAGAGVGALLVWYILVADPNPAARHQRPASDADAATAVVATRPPVKPADDKAAAASAVATLARQPIERSEPVPTEAPRPGPAPRESAPGDPRPEKAASEKPGQTPPPPDRAPVASARPPLSSPAEASRVGPPVANPRLQIASNVAVLAGQSQPFPIAVEPAEIKTTAAAIVMMGLPAGLNFSSGFVIQRGTWSIPASEAGSLVVAVPGDAAGRFELTLELWSQNSSLLASAATTLVVMPRAAPPSAAMSDSVFPEEGELLKLIASGRRQLESGHVAAARMLFRRAADAGQAEAARLLGDTYDPAKLYALGVRGTSGDMEKAIYWYERADELGDAQAKARLLAIGR